MLAAWIRYAGLRVGSGIVKYFVAILFAGAALAQQYELGGSIGYGFYHDGTIFSSVGTAEAGIRNRFAAGVIFGDEFSPYVSAELQYLYHDGHPFLQSPGVRADIQGNSEAATYNLLFHFKSKGRRLRPFLEGGVGAKGYNRGGPRSQPSAHSSNCQPDHQRHLEGGFRGGRRAEVFSHAAHAGAGGNPRLSNHFPAAADRARGKQYGARNRGAVHAPVRPQLHLR